MFWSRGRYVEYLTPTLERLLPKRLLSILSRKQLPFQTWKASKAGSYDLSTFIQLSLTNGAVTDDGGYDFLILEAYKSRTRRPFTY